MELNNKIDLRAAMKITYSREKSHNCGSYDTLVSKSCNLINVRVGILIVEGVISSALGKQAIPSRVHKAPVLNANIVWGV